jgi:predicted branched-subunit amino acid permease
LGSLLGVFAGQLVSDVKPLALDYTLPAMFIALLVMQLKRKMEIVVAVASGFLCVILVLMGIDRWAVMIATVIGASFGVAIDALRNNIRQGKSA